MIDFFCKENFILHLAEVRDRYIFPETISAINEKKAMF